MAKTNRYGWVKDVKDERDFFLTIPDHVAGNLPASVDLRPQCPPVYDQGQLGSCTANAIAAALEFDRKKQGQPDFTPSRLFIYYNERSIEGTVNEDSGAQIRDGIKSVAQWGDCPETEWPYDVSQFATQPPATCYTDAAQFMSLTYRAVTQDLDDLKGCLASGFPFVFGFIVYSSFESNAVAQTGIVPLPHWFERAEGGHAVMAVGYDDATERFIVRNSWGPDWGDKGYFYFPYQYMVGNQASDFWTVSTVS